VLLARGSRLSEGRAMSHRRSKLVRDCDHLLRFRNLTCYLRKLSVCEVHMLMKTLAVVAILVFVA
jgi:hypothetical protein